MAQNLIPPDFNQCQAEKPNGVNFMTLGGKFQLIRCTNKPMYIATENVAGADGQIGSMSLCEECKEVFLNQCGTDYATVKLILVEPKTFVPLKCAYKVHWTEHERGWGTRPDGTTLHIDKKTADRYIEEYWAKEKARNLDYVPDYYVSPSEPILCEVPEDVYAKFETEDSFWWDNRKWK